VPRSNRVSREAGSRSDWTRGCRGIASQQARDSILAGPTVSAGFRFASGIELGAGASFHVGHAYEFVNFPYLNENTALIIWPRVFAQIDYHPPRIPRLHFGAAVGYGGLTTIGRECDCYNVSGALNFAGPGLVAAPHVGLDWAVSRVWTMGPLFRLWLSPTDRYGVTGVIVAPELAFSATWF
jgi:hypothetical protein